jgi:hypothetical protein
MRKNFTPGSSGPALSNRRKTVQALEAPLHQFAPENTCAAHFSSVNMRPSRLSQPQHTPRSLEEEILAFETFPANATPDAEPVSAARVPPEDSGRGALNETLPAALSAMKHRTEQHGRKGGARNQSNHCI